LPKVVAGHREKNGVELAHLSPIQITVAMVGSLGKINLIHGIPITQRLRLRVTCGVTLDKSLHQTSPWN
jgi:hypothetical protein